MSYIRKFNRLIRRILLFITVNVLCLHGAAAQVQDIGEDAFKTTSIVFEDIDNDGDLDAVVGNADDPIQIYFNNGTATPFEGVTPRTIGPEAPVGDKVSLEVFEVNGDDDLTIAAGYSGQANIVYTVSVSEEEVFPVAQIGLLNSEMRITKDLASKDINGDDAKDLAVANSGQPNQLYLNNGTNRPYHQVVPKDVSPENDSTESIDLGDADLDGNSDIVVGNVEDPPLIYFRNDGTSDISNYEVSVVRTISVSETNVVKMGDADGDGLLDLAVGSCNQPPMLFLNNGTSTPFAGVTGANIGEEPYCTQSMAWGDVNDDGCNDLVLGSCDQPNRLFLNNCTSQPFNGVLGIDLGDLPPCTQSVALGDADGDDDLDVAFGIFGDVNQLILNNGSQDNPFGGEMSSPTPSSTPAEPSTQTPTPTSTTTGAPTPTPTDSDSGVATPTPTQTAIATPTSGPDATATNASEPTEVPLKVIAYTIGQPTLPGVPGKPGSPIPDLPGERFRLLSPSIISSEGAVCFGAQGASAGSRGVWTTASGELQAAVINGDEIADVSPPVRVEFSATDFTRRFVINASGQVTFQPLTDLGEEAILLSSGRDRIRTIASRFAGVTTFESLSQDGPLLDNKGNVAFFTAGAAREVWVVDPDGLGVVVTTDNDPAPGLPMHNFTGFRKEQLSGAGVLAIAGTASPSGKGLSGSVEGIWSDASGILDLVVSSLTEGGPLTELPDMPSGATPTIEDLFWINDVNEIAFEGKWILEEPGNNQTGQGIYAVRDDGAIRKVVSTTGAQKAFLQRNGNVIYSSVEQDNAGNFMVFLGSEADGAIYQTGSVLPTIPETVDTSLVSWVANDLGHVVFLVTLSGEGIHFENDQALFLHTPEEGTSKILREGDEIEVDSVDADTRTVVGFNPVFPELGPGRGTSLSNNGLFTTLVEFMDSSDAVIVAGTAEEESEGLVVNSVDDSDDGECDMAHCSLREAINASNDRAGLDTVTFDLPAKGAPPHVIRPTSPLPPITESVNLDGTSQGGYQGDPIIVLDGSLAGILSASEGGLTLKANACEIRGFVINNFSGHGIHLDEGGFHTIQNCFIGTTADGSGPAGNLGNGVNLFDSGANQIGGADFPEGNTISGNSIGVSIAGDLSSENIIEGNAIGLNSERSDTIGNAQDGIRLRLGAHNNAIGGEEMGEGNFIGGNEQWGVHLSGAETGQNEVINNRIGAGPDAGETGEKKPIPLGNGSGGVLIEEGASQNVLRDNLIAFNDGDGVTILSGTGNPIRRNTIFGNGQEPGDLAIDLGGDGETANDDGDGDEGPNDLLNAPVLNLAGMALGLLATPFLNVRGELSVGEAGDYILEVYSSDDSCRHTEIYSGSVTLSVTDELVTPFEINFANVVRGYEREGDNGYRLRTFVTATLTDSASNTSEAACRRAVWLNVDVNRWAPLFNTAVAWKRIDRHNVEQALLDFLRDFRSFRREQ